MIKKLKGIWKELGRSIFVGDRYDKNMRGIAIGAALIVIVNIITGTLNLIDKNITGSISNIVLILSFSLVFVFIVFLKKRRLALTFTVFAVVAIYS